MSNIANRFKRGKAGAIDGESIKFLMRVGSMILYTLGISLIAFSLESAVGAADVAENRGDGVNAVSAMTVPLVQSSGTRILNWNSFSLVTEGVVSLLQPSVHHVALDRLIATDRSVVLGRLSSDNQIALINPHKKSIENPVSVNTGEFLVTTLEIREEDVPINGFSSKTNSLKKEHTAVVHGETIRVSEQGYVTLGAPGVAGEGVIVANLGTAHGELDQTYTLDLMSDGLINYAISKEALSQVTGLSDKVLADSTLTRSAEAGQVILNANSAEDVITSVVNSSGVSRAHHLVVSRDGIVRLETNNSISAQLAKMSISSKATDHHGDREGSVPTPSQSDSATQISGVKKDAVEAGNIATDIRSKATPQKVGKINPHKQTAKTRVGKSQSTHSHSIDVPNHPFPKWMSFLDSEISNPR